MEEIYINIELIALLIVATLSLWIKSRAFNLKLIKMVFIAFLIINPLQLLLNLKSHSLLIDVVLIFFSEIIVIHNLISIIIKPNLDRLFQNSFVMIATSLIGIIFAENVLIIAGWLACLAFFILINFFVSGDPKEFNDYLPFIISISTGIAGIFIVSLFFSLLTSNVSIIGLNAGFGIYVIILLFAIGTLAGVFPFNLLLNKFFKDSDFQTLSLYMITLYSLLFFLIRSFFLTGPFSPLIGLIFLIISIIGLIVTSFNIFNELFINFGRTKISLRKTLGCLFILDFNSVLLMASLFFFIDLTFNSIILNYIFFVFLAKFLLMVPLQFKIKKVDTDSLNKVHNLFQEDRFLGISALISGLIVSFPISIISFYIILNPLFSFQIQSNIIIFTSLIIILVVHAFYVLTNIIGLSSISIKINFNN
jgi:hypothetical protein